MSTRPPRERILDILETIAEIQQFVADIDFEAFQDDRKTLKAVMADFAIIGEAAGQIPSELTSQHTKIPWAVMRAMRNRMGNVYFAVSPQILWDTIHQDLPPLIEPLQQLLLTLDDPQ
ncbi:MAG: DUF86 domain-containing protein [Caldilineaceae bacterium]|nr:DUF86 domain-containing protein [Caldilineaceae bacterium]